MLCLDHCPAPAKLNLFLHVIGKRDNGYHDLQSLFVLIDWCDFLHFECRPDGQLSRSDLSTALPEFDLCLNAARVLQRASGTNLGVHISIDKQIPMGAGLGGGSSNAATTLLALNRLWGLNWPRSNLLKLALKLGADVPFFVGGQPAWVEGIGERLQPLSLPLQQFVVIKPPSSTCTKSIFSSPLLNIGQPCTTLDNLRQSQSILAQESLDTIELSSMSPVLQPQWGRNDLQVAATAHCLEIKQALSLLHERFGNSRMTGSGSAVFAHAHFSRFSPMGEANSTKQPKQHEANLSGRGTPALSFNHAVAPVDELNILTWLATLPAFWCGRLCTSYQKHPLHDWAFDNSSTTPIS